MSKFFCVFAALLCSSLFAKAPSSRYFDLAYTDTQDSSEVSGITYRLGLELSDSIYFDTNRYKLEGSAVAGSPEVDVKNYAFGIKFSVSPEAFFYIDYSKLNLTDTDNSSNNGNIQSAGFRGMLTEAVEWQLEYNRTKFDGASETFTGNTLGIHYALTHEYSIFIEKVDWLDFDIATLGFRLNF